MSRLHLSLTTLLPLLLLAHQATAADFVKACKEIASSQGLPETACTATYDPANPPQPAVQDTLAVCRKIAPGFQLSTTAQWLTPFSTWVIPAFALLLLCPTAEYVGGLSVSRHVTGKGLVRRLVGRLKRTEAFQWVNILGDPASAFCGAFYEWINDLRLCYFLDRSYSASSRVLNRSEWTLVRLVISAWERLARPCRPEYQEKDHIQPVEKREQFLVGSVILVGQIAYEQPEPPRKPEGVRVALEFLAGYLDSDVQARIAIRGMLAGRVKFNVGVVLPALLYCGVAITVIVNAKILSLGDNDTAHSLAFGTWYIWLLFLSVLGNCYASHLSTEGVQVAFENMLRFIPAPRASFYKGVPLTRINTSFDDKKWFRTVAYDTAEELKEHAQKTLGARYDEPNPYKYSDLQCETTGLGDRYTNCLYWHKWLGDVGIQCLPRSEHLRYNATDGKMHYTRRGFACYLAYQVAGWVPVGFSCGCAAAISYTTPIAGLSCRSATHLVYGGFTLLAALCRAYVEYTKCDTRRIRHKIARWLYRIIILWNITVLLAGTAFQISGVYRCCQCTAGLLPSKWRGDTMIEFGVDTEAHRTSALIYWINVSYAAYVVVGVLCAGAVCGRNYNTETLMVLLDQ